MQKFRFSLESAMQHRQLQIDLQRAKLESLYAELRRLVGDEKTLLEEKEFADSVVKGVDPCFSLSLMALDNFSRHVSAQKTILEQHRTECTRRIAEQQFELMNAQRDYDLLDKLRKKKLAEWHRAAEREQEQVAADVHMARFARDSVIRRGTEDRDAHEFGGFTST